MSNPQPSRTAGKRAATRKPTRAQLRAMEARNASVAPRAPAATVEPAPSAPTTRRRARTQAPAGGWARGGARSLTLTRAQEYAYIMGDLRRLLIVGGVLLIIMLALLFVIEG
ncbi:MAG TPA: hypothetical protein VFU81_15855 [Thermomicrobiales bacterium]|nr:hypothetical protein [Thermomicrobiales bacterium]